MFNIKRYIAISAIIFEMSFFHFLLKVIFRTISQNFLTIVRFIIDFNDLIDDFFMLEYDVVISEITNRKFEIRYFMIRSKEKVKKKG